MNMKNLICAVCDQYTKGRQWWNRDKGYGICDKCAHEQKHKLTSIDMREYYGKKGEHYLIKIT